MGIRCADIVVALAIAHAESTEEVVAIETYEMLGSVEVSAAKQESLPQGDSCSYMVGGSTVEWPDAATLLIGYHGICFSVDTGEHLAVARSPGQACSG